MKMIIHEVRASVGKLENLTFITGSDTGTGVWLEDKFPTVSEDPINTFLI